MASDAAPIDGRLQSVENAVHRLMLERSSACPNENHLRYITGKVQNLQQRVSIEGRHISECLSRKFSIEDVEHWFRQRVPNLIKESVRHEVHRACEEYLRNESSKRHVHGYEQHDNVRDSEPCGPVVGNKQHAPVYGNGSRGRVLGNEQRDPASGQKSYGFVGHGNHPLRNSHLAQPNSKKVMKQNISLANPMSSPANLRNEMMVGVVDPLLRSIRTRLSDEIFTAYFQMAVQPTHERVPLENDQLAIDVAITQDIIIKALEDSPLFARNRGTRHDDGIALAKNPTNSAYKDEDVNAGASVMNAPGPINAKPPQSSAVNTGIHVEPHGEKGIIRLRASGRLMKSMNTGRAQRTGYNDGHPLTRAQTPATSDASFAQLKLFVDGAYLELSACGNEQLSGILSAQCNEADKKAAYNNRWKDHDRYLRCVYSNRKLGIQGEDHTADMIACEGCGALGKICMVMSIQAGGPVALPLPESKRPQSAGYKETAYWMIEGQGRTEK